MFILFFVRDPLNSDSFNAFLISERSLHSFQLYCAVFIAQTTRLCALNTSTDTHSMSFSVAGFVLKWFVLSGRFGMDGVGCAKCNTNECTTLTASSCLHTDASNFHCGEGQVNKGIFPLWKSSTIYPGLTFFQ